MNDLDWNRLRSGDNRALDPDHQDVFDLVAEQRAEIDRLRESADAAHKVADDLEAEVERLTRCIEICEETNDRVGTENERLRDLLAEALDSEISDYWYVRVGEALGR